ncbi:MAG: response regulator, partial [Bacteroidota bacterium]
MKDDTLNSSNFLNILIVDDIGDNLKLLDEILRPEGYKTRLVPNGPLAIKAAEKEKPDLILLDIMMPEMDGFEVCRSLKENPALKDIPIIFISASGDTNDIVTALNIGGVDYINKPFQAEDVKARVLTHLKLCRQNIELRELNATKNKFFSIIAHDLRSPFNGFLGLTRLMVEDLESLSGEDIKELSLSM